MSDPKSEASAIQGVGARNTVNHETIETRSLIVETIKHVAKVHGGLGFMDLDRDDNQLVPIVDKFLNSPELHKISEVLLKRDKDTAEYYLYDIIVLIVFSRGVSVGAFKRHAAGEWKSKRQKAVVLLREAAALLKTDYLPEWEIEPEEFDGFSNMAMQLADKVENNSPFEELFEEIHAERTEQLLKTNNFGVSGRASRDQPATRGALVRQMNQLIPDEISNRYSMISKLFSIRGLHISRQDVRGILLGGNT